MFVIFENKYGWKAMLQVSNIVYVEENHGNDVSIKMADKTEFFIDQPFEDVINKIQEVINNG